MMYPSGECTTCGSGGVVGYGPCPECHGSSRVDNLLDEIEDLEKENTRLRIQIELLERVREPAPKALVGGR